MARPNAFRQMLSFEGRMRRLDWWLIVMGVAILSGLAGFVSEVVSGDVAKANTVGFGPHNAISIAIQIAFAWLLLAASVKRSHDRGDSGALPVINLILIWLPLILAIMFPDSLKTPPLMWMLTGLVVINFLISVWLLITLGFLDGTPGANQYGTSPKGADARNYQAPRSD